jgi:hypothetical protein
VCVCEGVCVCVCVCLCACVGVCVCVRARLTAASISARSQCFQGELPAQGPMTC